jgi:F420-0:gamma-glutamyl ligase-like protein
MVRRSISDDDGYGEVQSFLQLGVDFCGGTVGIFRQQEGDILVIKHKIVSKAEGQLVELKASPQFSINPLAPN